MRLRRADRRVQSSVCSLPASNTRESCRQKVWSMDVAFAGLAIERLMGSILRDARLELSFEVKAIPGSSTPALVTVFQGRDVSLLLARNAELLLALEHIAAQSLRLAPEQHDMISFDAGGFKARRDEAIARSAQEAVRRVLGSHAPFHFAPMNSRERRLLHLALAPSGLRSQSEGEGPTRHLVLHPPSA